MRQKRGARPDRELVEAIEAARLETGTEGLRRRPDWGARPRDGGEDGRSVGRHDASQLVEERDHVEKDDEVECAVLERKLRGVGDVEAHSTVELGRKQGAGLFDHPGSEIDTHDLGIGEALGHQARRLARARAQVEDARRSAFEPVERDGKRRQSFRLDDAVPDGRQPLELRAERTAEEPPQSRSRDDDAGDEAGESAPERFAAAIHHSAAEIFSSSPALTPNISAAFPRLMASEMFQYASS